CGGRFRGKGGKKEGKGGGVGGGGGGGAGGGKGGGDTSASIGGGTGGDMGLRTRREGVLAQVVGTQQQQQQHSSSNSGGPSSSIRSREYRSSSRDSRSSTLHGMYSSNPGSGYLVDQGALGVAVVHPAGSPVVPPHLSASTLSRLGHVAVSPADAFTLLDSALRSSRATFVRSTVATSGQVAASCSSQFLFHPTVLWHHFHGHTTLPRLRSMASQCLILGLPHIFALLPPSPMMSCTPCVEGRLRATPHSSSLCPATAPFKTLHLYVGGSDPRPGPERESYFLATLATPRASPTSLWTPDAVSEFFVRGYLALVRGTSLDKLSARTLPCIFLSFRVGSSDYTFYHPPLHHFLDSHDVTFDESVSYYARYRCRVACQVPPPSPQSSSQSSQQPLALLRQVAVDSGGAGVGGAGTRGANSIGARA
ncbi:unnamed protein product, partial [Closterium sp. NIES-53]